ncbi:MAG: protein-glutamate O-methyltransferase CheR [Pseudomonadota bacterium]
MTPQTFSFFADFLYQRSGLSLAPEKEYLLENRIAGVLRKHSFASFEDLAARLKTKPNDSVAHDVVEAMSVTETSFFRDRNPFDHFVKIMLPHLAGSRGPSETIRIWSAAASSGQEAYSLAMLSLENRGLLQGRKVEITATDISPNVLEKAKAGLYSQFEVQRGMPTQYLLKYFEQKGDMWAVTPDVKALVNFQPFNLMSSFAAMPRFDIVFCRNVLIYFDIETKGKVLEKVGSILQPDGFMLLGSAETTMGVSDAFHPDPAIRSLYRKADYAVKEKMSA